MLPFCRHTDYYYYYYHYYHYYYYCCSVRPELSASSDTQSQWTGAAGISDSAVRTMSAVQEQGSPRLVFALNELD